MPRTTEPDDPLEKRKRELADKEKTLSARLSHITQSIGKPNSQVSAEQPVWRVDPEDARLLEQDETMRKAELRRKRAQDRALFFVLLLVSVLLLYLLAWVIHNYYVPHSHVISELEKLND